MKTISTLITLLCLCNLSVFGQKTDSIFFNPHTNSFKGKKELKKGANVNVFIENYNPFLYSYNVEITSKDNTKKLFEFLSGILMNGFSIEPISKMDGKLITITTLKSFNKLQEKYVQLQNELKNPYFDCDKVNGLLDDFTADENIYSEYLKLSTDERSKLVLTKEEIIKLSEMRVAVKYYLERQLLFSKNKCILKIAEYNTTGSSNTIKIKLLNKNNTNSLFDSIVGVKKIDIKNALKVDFSSGLFFTQNNEPQYFKSQLTNGSYLIGKEELNKYQIGINALAHIYMNKKNNFNITLGSGVTIDKAIHLLSGLSYKFSKSNIILNFGVDFSYYNELSDRFELNTEYTNDIEIKTKKLWNDALWFGVSYKL